MSDSLSHNLSGCDAVHMHDQTTTSKPSAITSDTVHMHDQTTTSESLASTSETVHMHDQLLRPNRRLVRQTQCTCTTKLLRLNRWLVRQKQCTCTTTLLRPNRWQASSDYLGSKTSYEHDLKHLDVVRTTIKKGKMSESQVRQHQKLLSLFKKRLYRRKSEIRLTTKVSTIYPTIACHKNYNTLLRQHRFTEKLIVSPDFIDV